MVCRSVSLQHSQVEIVTPTDNGIRSQGLEEMMLRS